MPPKRKSPAAAAHVAGSPMKTRSKTGAGKRAAEPAPAKAASAKKVAGEAAAAAVEHGRKRASKKEVPEKEAAEPKGRKRAKKETDSAAAVVQKEEPAAAATEQNGRKRAAQKVETAKAAAEPKGRKKAKKGADSEAAAMEEGCGDSAADGKRVIVEACTQCRQFKIRAQKVKEDLESSVPGVSVIINPEKPRRGCLEIREEGGEVFISLLNMPRPFTPMKKLDMDDVIKDIAKKIS